MSYATVSDVVALVGNQVYALLEVEDGADVAANAKLLKAIAVADATIDDHLRSRYALPLVSTHETLTAIAADLVRYRLASSRHDVEMQADIDAYDRAIRQLRDIRDGKTILEFPAPNVRHDLASPGVVQIGENATGSGSLATEHWLRNY